jgi:hypothetical protein
MHGHLVPEMGRHAALDGLRDSFGRVRNRRRFIDHFIEDPLLGDAVWLERGIVARVGHPFDVIMIRDLADKMPVLIPFEFVGRPSQSDDAFILVSLDQQLNQHKPSDVCRPWRWSVRELHPQRHAYGVVWTLA